MRLLRRLGNPLASEGAAFRWFLVIGGAIVAIALLVLLVRAVL